MTAIVPARLRCPAASRRQHPGKIGVLGFKKLAHVRRTDIVPKL
jgi:hypothetical protein